MTVQFSFLKSSINSIDSCLADETQVAVTGLKPILPQIYCCFVSTKPVPRRWHKIGKDNSSNSSHFSNWTWAEWGGKGPHQWFAFTTATDSSSIFLSLTIQTTSFSNYFKHFQKHNFFSILTSKKKRNRCQQQRTQTGEKAKINLPGMNQNLKIATWRPWVPWEVH